MRNIKNINENWIFTKKGESIEVNLPHTWNGKDGQDGGNDYYRGVCTYTKTISKGEMPDGDCVYLQFDGVNSSAKVYFNGTKVAQHDGGYSTFRARLDNIAEKNELKVEVDNSPNDRVYPQNADFTFYGGIYRDVTLIGVPEKHFDLDYHGAPGIMVTPKVDGEKAEVTVQAFCDGEVLFEIRDGESVILSSKVGGKNPECKFTIDNVHLWNGTKDPYLYTAVCTLVDGEETLDRVQTRFGCRTFKIDPQKGFILNGKEYPLRGVSRHQDRPEIGNALLKEHHKEDVELICEMGANTIRLAHYQHNQYFYDLCDEKGLVIWAEIPYISNHMSNGFENTRSQMTELICQNYNHPCIVVWGLSNEITMAGSDDEIVDNHKMLNDLAHSLDKTRQTTVAVVTTCSDDDPYTKISDVLSYNHYFGWYGGNVSMYGPWFDDFHKKYPNRAVGLSEYGCEALNWHSSSPEQGDYTEEYQAHYHEEVIKQIATRPYLWATHVWNMFDFAADARNEGGENGMNHKGLVTFDRKYKKDAFYAYQAWLSDKPMIHLCSKRYVERCEPVTRVTVYSNQPEVELFANGESVGKQKKGEFPFFYFDVKNSGETVITARAGELIDEGKIVKVDKFNENYRMKDSGEVINWFEINMPAGYCSINDNLGTIMNTFKGKVTLLRIGISLLKKLKGGDEKKEKTPKDKKKGGLKVMGMQINPAKMKISSTMMDMAKGFTVRRIISMTGVKFTKEQLLHFNDMLNKVKKSV